MLFLLASCLQLSLAQQQQTVLNAQIPSEKGATISHNPNTASISGSNYNIVIDNVQDEYDLKLSLNTSWGFNQDMISILSLSIDGYTPFPHLDTDLLMVFTVSDWQYFSFFIHLDNTNNIKSRIYPSLSTHNITRSVTQWISDKRIQSRWDRISNNGEWDILTDWNKQALWPLKFVIINDAIHRQTVFKFYHNITETYATGYIFHDCFVSDAPIDVYIMGDSNHETYTVSSVNITLNHKNPTINPTRNPTHNPSFNPTQTTSINPTQTPSVNPTQTPSISPTTLPSFIPTINPTLSPTLPPIKALNHRIVITVTFECDINITEGTISINTILKDITQRIVNDTCLNVNTTSIKRGNSIITSIVLVCGEVSIIYFDHDVLKHELSEKISATNDIDIISSETSIKVIPYHDYNYILTTNISSEFISTSTQTGETVAVFTMRAEYKILIWTIKLIIIQLLLCCILSVCIFTLKLRTKQLKNEQEKVHKMHTSMKALTDIDDAYDDVDDRSLTNNDTNKTNVNEMSTLYLGGHSHKRSVNDVYVEVPESIAATSVANTVDSIPTVSTSYGSAVRMMMSLFINQAKNQIQERSESKKEESLPPNVAIVSEAATWDTFIPSIPTTTHQIEKTSTTKRDIDTASTTITKTKTLTAVTTADPEHTLSPTLTFSGPKYAKI